MKGKLITLLIFPLILVNAIWLSAQTYMDINVGEEVSVRIAKSDTATLEFLKRFSKTKTSTDWNYVEIEAKFVKYSDEIFTITKKGFSTFDKKTRYLDILLENILLINKKHQKNVKAGIIIGGFVGGGLAGGLVEGTNTNGNQTGYNSDDLESFGRSAAILTGIAIGSATGFLLSKFFKKTKWDTVYIKPGYKK